MTHNGKTSKFTKISSQDYTNILYSDSDSDNIPDLKLPPIKGKKPKRRKAFTEQQDTFCNFWMVVKLITGVLFFIVLVVLASVSFWSLRQISDLQDKIAASDNSDKITASILKLQLQLAEVNVSVMSVKTGQGSLLDISNTIADIKIKLTALETSNKKLQESVSSSNEMLSVPKQVKMLSENAVTMGSDILHLKDTTLEKTADLDKRIAALEASVADKYRATNNSVDRQELKSFNGSLTLDLQSIRQMLTNQTTRVDALEALTRSKPDSALNTSNQEKVPETTHTVEMLEFLAFKTDIMNNFEHLNETFVAVSDELDTVADRLDSQDNAILNLTSAVSKIMNNIADHLPETLPESTTLGDTTTATSTLSSINTLQQEKVTDPTSWKTVIHIEGINSLKDLNKAFHNGWPVENGQLNIEELNNLGPADVNVNEMKQFDIDGNGLYSENEMAAALGFRHNPRCFSARFSLLVQNMYGRHCY